MYVKKSKWALVNAILYVALNSFQHPRPYIYTQYILIAVFHRLVYTSNQILCMTVLFFFFSAISVKCAFFQPPSTTTYLYYELKAFTLKSLSYKKYMTENLWTLGYRKAISWNIEWQH